ncbi:MAG: gluconate 2-dehydrogenase subunit 3 family protein [Gemmatimonadaceae bacterium]|nr:gluconate 2-dehydrogenase subunit 3 family protein [Gemmatimonadaceae bacterium]
MERRELLGWMVTTGGLAALNRLSTSDLLSLGRDAHVRAVASPVTAPALDARAAAIVSAAAERIIPATDTPGATQANVTAFIETMLGGWYAPADRERFVAGLVELDARARELFTRAFVTCDPSQQVSLLEEYDDAVSALRGAQDTSANAHWFAMLKYLTVWGYCTSEVGMRELLHTWPMPMRYDGNAKVGA